MVTDDETPNDIPDEDSRAERTKEELRKTRERLGEGADKAVKEFDDSVVDLLSWLLDTETRARIFVFLRENPQSTSEEVADGTGLYPSTVREALAELHEEEKVDRQKRESAGAGNNPYEYEAIPPSELVQGVVGQVQSELNAVFNLDRRLGGEGTEGDEEPVTISVDGTDEGPAVTDSESTQTTDEDEVDVNSADEAGTDADSANDTDADSADADSADADAADAADDADADAADESSDDRRE